MRPALAGAELGQAPDPPPSCRFLLAGIKDCPAGIDRANAPGPERDFVGSCIDRRHFLDAGGVKDGDQARDDGVEDLLCRRRQLARRLAGRDDRVVIAHLGVVDDSAREGQGLQIELADLHRLERFQVGQDAGNLALQVVAQIATNRSADS